MQLILAKNLDVELPQEVEFNFEDLKSGLAIRLEKYQGLIVTEDGIKEAQADRATLNKLVRSLEDARKNVKGKYLAPYEAFEQKMKILVEMTREPISAIDEQLKVFEERRIAEKQQQIHELFSLHIAELKGLVKFETLENPRWQNKTFSLTQIADEIKTRVDEIKEELTSLDGIMIANHSFLPHRTAALTLIYQGKGISAALAELRRLTEAEERQKARDETRKEAQKIAEAKAEQARKELEEQRKKQAEARAKEPEKTVETVAEAKVEMPAASENDIFTYELKVTGTRKALTDMRQWMADNGVTYEKI